MVFDIIVAIDMLTGGIGGIDGQIPWPHNRVDMNFFVRTTMMAAEGKMNAVIMGRNTWNSLSRPLSKRHNIVLTRHPTESDVENVEFVHSLDRALAVCQARDDIDTVFVIGGEQVYNMAMKHPQRRRLYLTELVNEVSYVYGNYFRGYEQYFENPKLLLGQETIRISLLTAKNDEEANYLKLMRQCIENPDNLRATRNARVYSEFGGQLNFDLSRHFPLLTSKRMAWKSIVRELLWFIRGSTNSKELEAQGVPIWKGNTTREFLDNRGLHHYEEGDAGPIYGFQWRHFGADYLSCDADYTDQGVDQLQGVIDTIRRDPSSRRIILCAWNPSNLDEMVLPPCHALVQFYVDNNNGLHCQMYQRSADMFLGVPFNIASYALLTYLVAHCTGLHPQHLRIVFGDYHVYEIHKNVVEEQICMRTVSAFPTLRINAAKSNIFDIVEEDIELIGYTSEPRLDAPMVA